MRIDILERKEEILEWIGQSQSKAYMCKQLNCKQSTLNSYLKKMNIEYSGNQGGKGIKSDPKRLSTQEFLKRDWTSSHKMKLRLWEDGVKEKRCEICGITEWLGNPAPLELHHVDGNRFNNDIDNLQILCANCHSQTPNNSGKKNQKIMYCPSGGIGRRA